MSRAPAFTEGSEIAGRYVLREPIASGGMAQVWEADDTVLGRRVAVKLLHPHLAGDPAFVSRFRAEAKAAARLSHQSIVAIYDTASEDGIEAIVMELIDGMTLRQYLDASGQLSLDDTVDLVTQVAGALDAAHGAKLVHRDIKPGNIMLCPDRRVKVTDFGIAKALEGGDHTDHGTMLGTAKYLAPEQVEGTPVDPRADIYSLGVVVYEALTGVPPFSAETGTATALARLRVDPRPPREINHELAPGVERVVLTALERDRSRRYPTAGAMAAALTAAAKAPDWTDATTIDLTSGGAVATSPVHRTPPGARAAPATGSAPAPAARRSFAGPLLIVLIVAGSFALGIGLILATTAGRDFFERVRDNLSGNDDGLSADDASTDEPPVDEASPPSAQTPDRADRPAEAPDEQEPISVPTSIPVASISDFDPLGDGEERPARVENAIDGDLTTAWASERYSNRSLGNLKEGVGLVLTLDETSTLDTLEVISPNQDWAARVYLADAPAAALSGWGEPIDARVNIDGNTTFDLRGVRAQAVLLWVTDLGNAPPRLRIEVAELALS